MRLASAAIVALFCTTFSTAEVHEITQISLRFQPASITVHPGDTVRWIRTGGTHDAVHGDPCNVADNPLFAIELTAANPGGEWVVPAGVNTRIPYFCTLSDHCDKGMIAEIIVEPRPGSNVIEILQSGVTFVPSVISVSPGDTVRWTHGDGGHTVSSGTHAPGCTEDNIHFNMPLDDFYSGAIWEVPESMPEQVDYLCIYHCEMGHVGTIKKMLVGDFNGDGEINGADLTVLLSCWDDVCGDLNGDGITDGSDLATLLGNWTL